MIKIHVSNFVNLSMEKYLFDTFTNKGYSYKVIEDMVLLNFTNIESESFFNLKFGDVSEKRIYDVDFLAELLFTMLSQEVNNLSPKLEKILKAMQKEL